MRQFSYEKLLRDRSSAQAVLSALKVRQHAAREKMSLAEIELSRIRDEIVDAVHVLNDATRQVERSEKQRSKESEPQHATH